jgi:hypothetical protein
LTNGQKYDIIIIVNEREVITMNTVQTLNRTIQLNNLTNVSLQNFDSTVTTTEIVIGVGVAVVLCVGVVAVIHWILNR